jgi:transposase
MSQYSNTLRKRVLEEIDKKVPKKLVSKQFSIHVNTINNWLKLRKKDENNWKTKPRGLRGSKILDLLKLEKFIQENPDMYLEEIAQKFNSNDSTISYWMLKMGFKRKKNRKFTKKLTLKKDKNI